MEVFAMKKEFLTELGIEETVAKQIMVEHAKDIQAANAKTATAEQERDGLSEQLTERDQQLTDLKKTTKDSKELQEQISQLQEANKNKDTEWQSKVAGIQRDYAVNNALRDAKAKNPKAVKALLDLDKVELIEGSLTNSKDQLEAVQKSDAYLFDINEAAKRAGGIQITPKGNPGKQLAMYK